MDKGLNSNFMNSPYIQHFLTLSCKVKIRKKKITEVCRPNFQEIHTTSVSERNLQHHSCHDSQGGCITKLVPILAVCTGADAFRKAILLF